MTGIILLAAGQSARMGTPKQQLAYNGGSLLEHAVATAAGSRADVVVVVLGFEANKLQPETQSSKVFFTVNEAWQTGMGSSVGKGTGWLLSRYPAIDDVIVMLCDQPFVTPALLNKMMDEKASGDKGIIASAYANTVGVPALFGKFYFPILATLQGETGARKILKQFADDMSTVYFPEGVIDIDTMEDYHTL